MLGDYRRWLQSELTLLGNASHHAYAFGQANMAKRALERLDAEIAEHTFVAFTRAEAESALAALDDLGDDDRPRSPALEMVRTRLSAARLG